MKLNKKFGGIYHVILLGLIIQSTKLNEEDKKFLVAVKENPEWFRGELKYYRRTIERKRGKTKHRKQSCSRHSTLDKLSITYSLWSFLKRKKEWLLTVHVPVELDKEFIESVVQLILENLNELPTETEPINELPPIRPENRWKRYYTHRWSSFESLDRTRLKSDSLWQRNTLWPRGHQEFFKPAENMTLTTESQPTMITNRKENNLAFDISASYLSRNLL